MHLRYIFDWWHGAIFSAKMIIMELQELDEDFQDLIELDPSRGCWIWAGKCTPAGYPSYKRQAAWKWAYKQMHGELPKGRYPSIEQCEGPLFCANPDHRLGLPTDQRLVRHQCPVCRAWHEPGD